MAEIGGAFFRGESVEEFADLSPGGLDGSLICLSDQCLELGEHHFDRVEVGTVGWEEQEVGPGLANGSAGGLSFVTAEVVENDHVAWGQCWHQRLLDPGCEGCAIDWTIQNEGSDNTVMAQPCQERQRLPMSMGNLGQERRPPRAPSSQPRHVGLHPGLVEKNQARRIKLSLMGSPAMAQPGNLRPILLLGQQSFF